MEVLVKIDKIVLKMSKIYKIAKWKNFENCVKWHLKIIDF